MCQGVTTGGVGGGVSTVERKLSIFHCVYCLANSKAQQIVQIHVQLVPGGSTDGFALESAIINIFNAKVFIDHRVNNGVALVAERTL